MAQKEDGTKIAIDIVGFILHLLPVGRNVEKCVYF